MEKKHIWNYGAGPGMLPTPVLEKIKDEFLNWADTGMSVLEVSHRSTEFEKVIAQAESDLRALLKIPDNYKVLFLQGGATLQFSAVPLNLLKSRDSGCEYIVTGVWSEKAAKEVKRLGFKVNTIFDPKNYTTIPGRLEKRTYSYPIAYRYYCANETVHGVEFQDSTFLEVENDDIPWVVDMSSNFLSRPVDVSKYGMIFAGAQKNVGPAGLVIVIIRESLLGNCMPNTPLLMDYQLNSQHSSMYNTPPTFSIYAAGLVFKWLLNMGGLKAIEQVNLQKSQLIYQTIQASDGFYRCPVESHCRSRMNIPFRIFKSDGQPCELLEKQFLHEAESQGLLQLAGHRSVGGLRASLYNAMPYEGALALAQFMTLFQEKNQPKK